MNLYNPTYLQIKQLVSEDFNKLSKVINETLELISKESTILSAELSNYLNSSSKQLRSCLIFLFSQLLYKKTTSSIIKLAAAVELIHNATLIHDDIIDNADYRRGEKAIHKKFGNKLSIITGDYLLSLAIKLLTSTENPQIISNFSDCLNELCKGEINQYFSAKSTQSIEEYLKKTRAKTSSLFCAALKSLADLENNTHKKNLYNFATYFGTAFQIKDDLNNFTNENNKKPLYLDIENGNFPPPVIYAFGENKNLSEINTEEIIAKASQEKYLNKTKDLIKNQANAAQKILSNLPQNLYNEAIQNLCKNITK